MNDRDATRLQAIFASIHWLVAGCKIANRAFCCEIVSDDQTAEHEINCPILNFVGSV